MPGATQHTDLLKNLGKHKAGKGSLYIKKMEDVNSGVLESLVKHSVDSLKKKYPGK